MTPAAGVLALATAEILLARIGGSAARPVDLAAAAVVAALLVAAARTPARPRVHATLTALPPVVYALGVLPAVAGVSTTSATLGVPLLAALALWVLGGDGGRPLGGRAMVALYGGCVASAWLLLAVGQARPVPAWAMVATAGALAACAALGRWAPLLLPLALWPVGEAEAWTATGPAPRGPDVVLITVDTLRVDAARGMRAFAGMREAQAPSPWTLPSLATLSTGLLPARHGAGRVEGGYAPLAEGRTLAERLAEAGWDTAATVEQPFLDARFGLARGFARWRNDSAREWAIPRDFRGGRPRPVAALALTYAGLVEPDPRGASLRVADARELLDARRDRPLFLWVHFLDAHLPYRHVPAFASTIREDLGEGVDADALRAAYGEEVRVVDDAIGELRALLRPGTLVVLAADHGEEFGDHGGWEHGHTMYQELLAVPLVVDGVDGLADRVAGLEDVVPTVLGAVGLPAEGLDGRDLRVPGDVPHPATNPLYGDLDLRAVRVRDAKRIAHGDARETYDLATDPGERRPLADDTLEALLPPPPGEGGPAAPLDPDVAAALRALGYQD